MNVAHRKDEEQQAAGVGHVGNELLDAVLPGVESLDNVLAVQEEDGCRSSEWAARPAG